MESQIKCNDTTDENIPNTLEKPEEKPEAEKPYTLLDMQRLKFKLDESGDILDVETCTPEQFNTFAQAVADVDNVDISVWPLEERRNLINELRAFCKAEDMEFPLIDVDEAKIATSPLLEEAQSNAE